MSEPTEIVPEPGSSVKGDGTPNVSPWTRKPYHQRQYEVDRACSIAMDELFDALHNTFVRVSRRDLAAGKLPMKPSDLQDALRSWDLDEPYVEWWYDGKDEGDLEDEPWA